jgi:nicotinamidase-related amidase
MRILKENSIGLIIDIQERLFPHIQDHQTIQKNVELLIKGLELLNVPILVTEQYKKGLGETVEPLAQLIQDYPAIEKMTFSCCDTPQFTEKLELSTKRHVIIAGIESHICVLQTAIDLQERGFHPLVVADCIGSRTHENKSLALIRMQQEGILLSSTEAILFELCRKAGTDTFKAISKLVK